MRVSGVLFSKLIINAALSGREAYMLNMMAPISVQSLVPLQQLLFKFARAVLRGKHTKKQQDGIRSISILEVQKHLKCGTQSTELRIRRLRCLQDVIWHRQAYEQAIAPLVG